MKSNGNFARLLILTILNKFICIHYRSVVIQIWNFPLENLLCFFNLYTEIPIHRYLNHDLLIHRIWHYVFWKILQNKTKLCIRNFPEIEESRNLITELFSNFLSPNSIHHSPPKTQIQLRSNYNFIASKINRILHHVSEIKKKDVDWQIIIQQQSPLDPLEILTKLQKLGAI